MSRFKSSQTFFISLFTLLFLLAACYSQASNKDGNNTINPVIGDISFVKKFGVYPDSRTGENLRVKTHLEYVENLLRSKDASSLPTELRRNRVRNLDLLHEYLMRAIFPKNYAFKSERRPCFIDGNNNICAVGYLVEQSSGRELAEKINEKFQYYFLSNMNDVLLAEWVKNSGLTAEECAMIQPTYGFENTNPPNITAIYALSTSLASGLNLTMSTLNAIDFAGKNHTKSLAIAGMLTGALQITLGALNMEERTLYSYVYDERKMVSMINIGLGTATMLLSTINLLSDDKKGNTKGGNSSLNFITSPAKNKDVSVGLKFTKRF